MIKNYIKIALRNFKKQKIYSVITLSGLTLGLAVFTLFALLVNFITTQNKFHDNFDRIYSVVQVLPGGIEGDQHKAIFPAPFLPALLSEFPEIEAASRFFPTGRMIVKHQDKVFYESRMRFVDPSFLSIFTFNMTMGNAETALSKPYSVVLTEASALKYFGDENPIGQSLTLANKVDVRITGITENVPTGSSINYDFLVSMETANALYDWMDDWKINNQAAFLLLAEGYEPAQMEAKFPTIINKYFADSSDSPKQLYLHPMSSFALNSLDIERYWSSGRASFIALWITAVLLLFIACINYMNLSTARHATRAREVGMRKVIGADRLKLIKQFLGESLIMSLLALPASILLYELLRPAFIAMFDDFLEISIWDHPQILILLVVVALLTGIFAGSYPAFYLSAFKPVRVLKGNLQHGKKGGRLRKTLVVTQFVFSIILIVLTIVSIRQDQYNLKVDLGYDRNQILAVEIVGEAQSQLENLKNEVSQYKDIVTVSASTALPIEWDPQQPVLPEGVTEEEKINMNVYGIDYDFIEMLNIKITEGRSFSRNFSETDSFIINETAAKQLQWQNPVGRQLTIGDQTGSVIGVAQDFHFKELYLTSISPAVLRLSPDNLNYMLVKYANPESANGVVDHIRTRWNALTPDLPFEHINLNTYFKDVFRGDKTAEMTGALGGMAIFLSCLGLLGLSSFAVQRKTKEIGIRKVLGASVPGIIRMHIKEFLKLVIIANIIAIPIAYFLMNRMIQFLFSYPVGIGADIFIFTAGVTLLITFVTVTSQTLKAAQANPVESLKYE